MWPNNFRRSWNMISNIHSIFLNTDFKIPVLCLECSTFIEISYPNMYMIKESISFCHPPWKKTLKFSPPEVNNNGWSALIWSAINGCEEVASTLLAASANYLTADNEGRSWGLGSENWWSFVKDLMYTQMGGCSDTLGTYSSFVRY